jgi:hypothetical protein
MSYRTVKISLMKSKKTQERFIKDPALPEQDDMIIQHEAILKTIGIS